MTLPQQFGVRQRVTPTRSSPTSMPLAEMSIYKPNNSNVTNPENAIDGNDSTFAQFTVNGKMWIDLGGWFKIANVMVMWDAQSTTMTLNVNGWRTANLNFSGGNGTVSFGTQGDAIKRVNIFEPTGVTQKFIRYIEIKQTLGTTNYRVHNILVSTT